MEYPVEIPDDRYWKHQICCQDACPVHTDARGYVRAIASGDDALAYLIARGPNPLASICGRICGAPCEAACRRGNIDKPIAIRALKRYVCELFGPESRDDGGRGLIDFLQDVAARHGPPDCRGREDLLGLFQSLMVGDIPRLEGTSVGIIGSGPAGLAAAHDLALLGASVTVYELEPVLGGMLAVGIPDYRLPRSVIAAEVEVITGLGVEAVTGCAVGRDVSFPQLRERHDAVIIAVGAKRSRAIKIPGIDAEGVLGGVEFLRDVALGKSTPLGERVVVIGGGNVAYDVGRTVVRQTSVDAARTAMRTAGVKKTYLCSLESLDEMPADDVEIIEGDEEGIIRCNSLGPTRVLTDRGGRCRGVVFQRCLRVFDENRRFAPEFDPRYTIEIECDNVLLAIGQTFDLRFVDSQRDGIELDPRGAIRCDPETGETSAGDVWVAGDLAHGPKLLIHAVASGKAVARSIYERFTGRALRVEDTQLHFPQAGYRREPGYEKIRRETPPTLPPEERKASQKLVVEKGFTEEQARREASRCLDCAINTIFDGARCILCGGCVDVCPELCLRIVSLDRMNGTAKTAELRSLLDVLRGEEGRSGRDRGPDGALDGEELTGNSAIIKDEDMCIRCGLCAERCPSGAITMERFRFTELLCAREIETKEGVSRSA